MAGKPKTRDRREREALERGESVPQGDAGRAEGVAPARRKRAAPVDPATRRAGVRRADEVGTSKAALEFSVASATIRSWRSRVAAEPEPPEIETSSPPKEPGSLDEVLALAEEAGRAALGSLRQVSSAAATGRSIDAYRFSFASKQATDQLAALSVAVERLKDVRAHLDDQRARLTAEVRSSRPPPN